VGAAWTQLGRTGPCAIDAERGTRDEARAKHRLGKGWRIPRCRGEEGPEMAACPLRRGV
jgi:hypothetical protein